MGLRPKRKIPVPVKKRSDWKNIEKIPVLLLVFVSAGLAACVTGPDLSKVALNPAPSCRTEALTEKIVRNIVNDDFWSAYWGCPVYRPYAEKSDPEKDAAAWAAAVDCQCKSCVDEAYKRCVENHPDCGMRGCRGIAQESCTLAGKCR